MIQQLHSGYWSKGNKNMVSKGDLYLHVYSSIIYNSQKMEARQLSIVQRIDKQSEILSSLKNKGNWDTGYSLAEHEDIVLSEISQTQRDK